MYKFDLTPLIWFGALIVLAIWGAWELIDFLFIFDGIKSSEPIVPEIQLIIKDNVVDTLYIYNKP